ncbi:MAG TPA: LamG-like jellyroll fold domain-containing protein, partial [Verrucomicrobiae bacterium]|nr:LamG-like jellyroll fold domain-containing protein [Verrucomicrobiae bacterium]
MQRKIQGGLVLICTLLALPLQAAGLQQLHGQVPRAAANLAPIGRVPSSQHLSFAIGLPLRNRGALSNLLQQIYDPASANYHHYLTPEQFTEQFGPTAQDYEAVAAFARANGLTISARHPNRTLLDVEGSVADIEKALHVRMNSYQHPEEPRTFYAPDADPSLDLAVPLAGISGLDNYSRPRPRLVATRLDGGHNATPSAGGPFGSSTGSGPFGTYLGKDFRAAYAPDTTLTGAGQSVGLLQFDGYTTGDITYYETEAGLPNVTLTNVLLDGFTGIPTGSGGEVEVSLDIEMSISMAPGLSKVIVYMAGPFGNWHDILNRMANDNLAKQLSCSWFIPGGAADAVADGIFQQMAAQGQSFMNASGDSGAYTGLISFPGDTPYITQVGGTTLTTTGPVGARVSETTWTPYSGGGVSTQYPIPSWQSPVTMTANYGSTTMRNTPDVALTADNVYVRVDGSDYFVGGTSCAAPLWAGFLSLVNQQAAGNGLPSVGFLNPVVYNIGLSGVYAQAFHDITTGNNGSATHFPAVAGYDLCTGWGTPNGQQLINAIVPPDSLVISPTTGFTASGAVGGPFNVTAQNFTLTNTSAGTLTWSVGNPVSWLSTSSSGGVLSAGLVTNLLVSLDSASSNLAPGFYTANLAVTNVTSNFTHLLPFSLLVHDPLVISPTNGFNSAGPVGGPFSVTSLNLSLSNSGLAALGWSLSNNATWLDVSSGGGTLAPGATTNVMVSLDASADTLPPALYSADVVVSNLTSGLVQSVPFTLQTGQLPVQNGGFELGNFLGWTVSGNTIGMLVTSNSLYVHSGVYGAQLGSEGSPGFLSQTLATSPGQVYLISFWMENEGVGGVNDFQVDWNGSVVFDEPNAGRSGWTNIQVLVGASGTNSVLQFGDRNDNGNFGLDDVAVFQSAVPGSPPTITSQPINETVIAGLTTTFSAAATGIQPLYYQWQLGASNIAGANGPTLVLSPTTPAEAGNYTLVVSNAFGMTNSSNAVLTVNVPNCDPPAAGLVSWWAAEGNANDSFGINNGTLTGGMSFTSGVVGQAFQFDGATGYVSIPASSSLNVGTNGGLTIETWIKPADLNKLALLAEWNNGAGSFGSSLSINESSIYGGTGSGSFFANLLDVSGNWHTITSPPNLLSSNSFNHLAVTYDKSSGTGTLYLNGTIVASQNLGTFTPQTSYNLILGSRPSLYYFGGVMDEMSLYNAALSSNQIQAVYNAGSAGKCSAPPVVTSQPQNQTVVAGNSASFSVNANGSQPLSYQWQLNQTNISVLTNATATNATLMLTNVPLDQSGSLYSVVISNLAGSTNSSNAVLTVLAPNTCTPPNSGLVSWWAAEGNANDSLGNNNGTLVGGVNFTNGEVGQAFLFDGATGYVSIPASASLNVGTNQGLTIEAWIKPNQVSTLGFLVEWNNGAGSFASSFAINEPAVYGGGGPGSLFANLVDTGGNWHTISSAGGLLSTGSFNHVAVTYDKSSGTATLYLNGTNVASQNLGVFTPLTTYNLILGSRPSSYYFGGLMDEMSLYNTALSALQVQAIYNAGSGGKCALSPVIVSQPQSQTVFQGRTASFSVGVNGSQPLSYQWFVNETNIPTATTATLLLTNVQSGQSGNLYSVLIANQAGSTNSSNALLTVNPAPPCTPPPSGLISWWAAEGNANDSFGTNNGTLTGGISFTAGEVGQAFQFDGATGYVSISAAPSLDVGAGPGFTIEGWIKPADLATRPLAEWNSGSGSLGSDFWINQPTGNSGAGPGSLFANIIDTSGSFHTITSGGNILPANALSHVALTYDKSSGTAALYLNGAIVASQNLGVFTPRTSYNLYLGYRPPSSPYLATYYSGLMDEMSLYGRALAASEIQAIYIAGGEGKCAIPPVIASQPVSQTAFSGSTVSFSVTAGGSKPLDYQWFVNAASIPAATNATLVLTNVQ